MRLPRRHVPNLAPAAALAGALLVAAACAPTLPGLTTAPGTPAPARTQAGSNPTRPPVSLDFVVTLERFAEVPGGPLAIAAAADGSGTLYVASQDGRIWAVASDGSVANEPLVDLSPRLSGAYEQGLLGLALHPRYPDDPRAFVNYTNLDGDTIIASLELTPGDQGRIDASHRQLLVIGQPYANHNGGGVLFGPDGYLYLALGDGGSGGDPHDNGQRLDTLLGKILRIDIDADGREYGIPDGNPFAGRDGMDEIWHYGLRNPWRLSFDRGTGDLWIGDVGQGQWEEIDVARAGEGGLNFGWNRMEGAHCYGDDGCSRDGLTLPVTEYGHDLGCTVIGGYVYRGAASPVLEGAYLFADYCSGVIFAIGSSTDSFTEPAQVGQSDGPVSAFGEDANGELYITTLDGTIYRVTATER